MRAKAAPRTKDAPAAKPRIPRLRPMHPEKPPNRRFKSGHQFLSRASIDGRLAIAQKWDRLVDAIESDLGGTENLSAIERRLVQAFAGVSLALDDLNGKSLLGQPIIIADLAQTASTLVRIGSRLGIHRRTRDATPSILDIIARHSAEAGEDAP